eukprot:14643-Heterococcus_DN1.PRE.3
MQDALLNVWSLPDAANHLHGPGQADLLFSDEAVDCVLTGVAFRKDTGTGDLGIVTTAYDSDVLHSCDVSCGTYALLLLPVVYDGCCYCEDNVAVAERMSTHELAQGCCETKTIGVVTAY